MTGGRDCTELKAFEPAADLGKKGSKEEVVVTGAAGPKSRCLVEEFAEDGVSSGCTGVGKLNHQSIQLVNWSRRPLEQHFCFAAGISEKGTEGVR